MKNPWKGIDRMMIAVYTGKTYTDEEWDAYVRERDARPEPVCSCAKCCDSDCPVCGRDPC